MAMSNPIKSLKRPDLSRGRYQGYVVDNKDPDKRQRVKIRIPQLHRNVPDSDLPWVRPSHRGQANAGSGVGRVDVPPEGALMDVSFDEDDPHNPLYHGSPALDKVAKDNEILNEDYPHTVGEVDDSGNKWTINKLRKEALFQHVSGSSIFMDGAGNITLNAKSKLVLNGSTGVDVTGSNINVHSPGQTDVKGQDINLNNSGTAKSTTTPTARTTPTISSSKGQTSL